MLYLYNIYTQLNTNLFFFLLTKRYSFYAFIFFISKSIKNNQNSICVNLFVPIHVVAELIDVKVGYVRDLRVPCFRTPQKTVRL